jgi:hypothetical protein
MSYISVDIDIDDILWEMSSGEKQELVDDLYDDGYIPTKLEKSDLDLDSDFDKACVKLIGNSWRLTCEEEDFILNISKRF